jgi:hypothetical protein
MSLKESRRISEERNRIKERLEDDIAEKGSLYAARMRSWRAYCPKS